MSKQQNFSISFTVSESPQEVFKAINNVRAWWGEGIQGSSDKVGAKFKYRHEDLHVSSQKVTEMIPGKKVVWSISESQINFVEDKEEWEGTEIIFEIAEKGKKTEVTMTHVGLVPALACYGDCSGAWTYYFGDSLKSLITTGKGKPDPKEAAAER